MLALGFVAPLHAEAQPLIQLLDDMRTIDAAGRVVYSGNLLGLSTAVIISGPGKIRAASATQLLIDRFPASEYVHYGTAGALADALRIGDVICATAVVEHDVRELFPASAPAPVHLVNGKLAEYAWQKGLTKGVILSGDEDIVHKHRKHELLEHYQGLSVDWESASFIFTCHLNKVRGSIFRGISDMAHEDTHTEYGENQSTAINNTLRVIRDILPAVIRCQ